MLLLIILQARETCSLIPVLNKPFPVKVGQGDVRPMHGSASVHPKLLSLHIYPFWMEELPLSRSKTDQGRCVSLLNIHQDLHVEVSALIMVTITSKISCRPKLRFEDLKGSGVRTRFDRSMPLINGKSPYLVSADRNTPDVAVLLVSNAVTCYEDHHCETISNILHWSLDLAVLKMIGSRCIPSILSISL